MSLEIEDKHKYLGKLLIAHPNLSPLDWFHRTVIYVYSYSKDIGALGLVLNVASKLTVSELCAQHSIDFPYNRPVYIGGPVTPSSVIMLHSNEWHSRNTATAGPGYSVTSDYDMFEKIAESNEPAYWRITAGISSWGPGQLEQELAGEYPYRVENSWLIADANDRIIFDYDGERQWEEALSLSSKQLFDTWI